MGDIANQINKYLFKKQVETIFQQICFWNNSPDKMPLYA